MKSSDEKPPPGGRTITVGPTGLPSELLEESPLFADAPRLEALGGRYEIRDHIATGGMGEVWRVFDRTLGTTLAMKVLSGRIGASSHAAERFRAEARVAASLQHPGAVPVHDLGELADGRPFYTMMEVPGGRELRPVVRGFWAEGRDGPDPVELRRLVDVLYRVASTVGYAHARGIVHLDLKPSNIMLGQHGEVLVMDWGLARTLEELQRIGHSGGTPGYMAPEQALQQRGVVDARADVYALGAILVEFLTGRPPRAPGAVDAPHAPGDLVDLARRATAAAASARPTNGALFAAELRAWLDGARRQERATALTNEADRAAEAVALASAEARRLRVEHAHVEAGVRPWHAPERKRPLWEAADRLDEAERAVEAAVQTVELGYTAALREHPEHAPAHLGLARLYHRLHEEAEGRRDHRAADRFLSLLRAHDRGWYSDYVRGTGSLTLHTDPPGAQVHLRRLARRDLRLVPVETLSLGPTPLVDVELPMGSYLAELSAPGRALVRYPVYIRRGERWDGVPPGARQPLPVPLPLEGALGPDDVYVPPGWFQAGGDDRAAYSLPASRIWLPGFVLRRFAVTNREYAAFLDRVATRAPDDVVAAMLPRNRPGPRAPGEAFFEPDALGHYRPVSDGDGDTWDLDWPVVFVDLACARALAADEASRTGQPWRLPSDLEWEKAARGVDGRMFPWGDDFEATFARLKDSERTRPLPCRVAEYPLDESPYGVRGLAGNARCWCADPFLADPGVEPSSGDPDHVPFCVRGGSWTSAPVGARSARRTGAEPASRMGDIGIRLARSWP